MTAPSTSEPSATDLPLDGFRVVELTQWVAGPAAAGLLADWGGDVIKVEAPSGDPQRSMFAAVGIDKPLPNPSFAQDNRGKRSIALDLRDDDDRSVMDRLLGDADVFVTNLRLDALERLGLDPASVSEAHPRIVVCSITGYGPLGPARDVPGYDIGAFVARTGLARTNAPEESPPVNLRGGIGDHLTGMTAVAGIGAALLRRERTGRGGIVETSLFQAGLYGVSWDLSTQATFGRLSRMKARDDYDQPLVNSYRAGDGRWFYLIGLELMRHLPNVLAAAGLDHLVDDARFASGGAVREHRVALIAELDAAFATEPLEVWAERFARHDVWWAPCQTMAEVVDDPQAQALGTFMPTGDTVTVASPIRFDGERVTPRDGVPGLDEHGDEIRRRLDGSNDT